MYVDMLGTALIVIVSGYYRFMRVSGCYRFVRVQACSAVATAVCVRVHSLLIVSG